MNKDIGIYIVYAVFVAVIVILFALAGIKEKSPGKYDEFAQCISDSGTIFYGAFWCPHCAEQKAFFGKSAEFLPYIECSTPDRSGQTQICIDKEITSYPTWIDSNNIRYNTSLNREMLAVISGCDAPADSITVPIEYLEEYILGDSELDLETLMTIAEEFEAETGTPFSDLTVEDLISYQLRPIISASNPDLFEDE